MTNVSKPKMFQIWSKKIMLGLLKPGLHRDRRTIREKLVKYVDERGLNLNDAATLQAFENSEVIKQKIVQLMTPQPGEKSNLEQILAHLVILVRSNQNIMKGQAALAERLDAIELQITEQTAFLMHQNSPKDSTCS